MLHMYNFLVTLLPFPQTQLSTDDFDGALFNARHTSHVTRHTSHVTRHTSHISHHTPGVLYNATNLAMKGVASIAAYGYLVETYKGDVRAAEEAYATAAQYVHRDP